MPSVCIFDLNKSTATYFSGETISGTISLKTSEIDYIRNICIIFNGEGKVKWADSVGIHDKAKLTIHFKSHKVYVNNCNYIYNDNMLPGGEHKWNFNISLPLQCPTSLEGKYGRVRYEIILKIQRRYRPNKIFRKLVTIIKTIDLNLNPIFKRPLSYETIKTLRYLTLSKGEIIFSLFVPFAAYVPGQTIKYTLTIRNKSKTDIKNYSVIFSKKITFTADDPKYQQRHYKEILFSEICTGNCLSYTNRTINGSVTIPSTPPSSDIDDIICVHYKLKFILKLSGFSRNPDLSVPIIIGTIPIRESLRSRYTSASSSSQPAEPVAFAACSSRQSVETTVEEVAAEAVPDFNTNLPPCYSEIEPPAFEEATGFNSALIDTDNNTKFAKL